MIGYISGKMTGVKWFNFPAFDRAAAELRKRGHTVLNPADMDREAGFDAMKMPEDSDWSSIPSEFSFADAITRDIDAVRECDFVFVLSGYETSSGAKAEIALAEWIGKDVIYEDDVDYDYFSYDSTDREGSAVLDDVERDVIAEGLADGSLVWVDVMSDCPFNFEVAEEDDGIFPEDAQERKTYPVLTGLLNYFPHACAAVAHHSFVGNEQHNAGEAMHWAKEKSIGDGNQVVRHTMEGTATNSPRNTPEWDEEVEALQAMFWRAGELLERKLTGLPPFDKEW